MGAWIVAVLLGLLLLWNIVRERFEATASIQAPPYDDAAKRHIYETANTANQTTLMNKAIQENSTETDPEKLKALAGAYIAPTVGEFFTTVFKPATVPITEADVNRFMTSRTGDLRTIETQVLKTYFVGQQGIGTAQASGYAEVLAGLGQNVGYLVDSPTGPTGTAAAGATGAAGPTGPTGVTDGTAPASATGATGPPSSVDPTTGTTTSTPAPSGTTGGSSVSSYAPTDGSAGNLPVWGPAWSGVGETAGRRPGADSSTTTVYPILLGGHGGNQQARSRIDGVGVTNASGSGITLPPIETTGSEPNSQFLPNARVPAASGLGTDPYRLASTFSSSNYSSKTDPVPFLTDFSAFFK